MNVDPNDTRLSQIYSEYRSGKQMELPSNLDSALMGKLAGRRILVTGAGSVGGKLVEQLLNYQPGQLIVADISEYSLHHLKRRCEQLNFEGVIDFKLLDVNSIQGITDIMSSYQVDIIIHTAAYKHLPLLESNVRRAIEVNFMGTVNLIEAARDRGVSEMVFVSTDKAVEPTSVLGMTKLLAENYIRSQYQDADISVNINIARFGNVLGSSGSVVPIWEDCIKNGRPLPISDPKAERFFLSSSQANQLILSTLLLGRGGETFAFDMGDPVRILELAANIYQNWKGNTLSEDQIEWVGLKAGEKITERFYEQDASLYKTDYDKVLRVKPSGLPEVYQDKINQLKQNIPQLTESELTQELISFSRWDKADSLK